MTKKYLHLLSVNTLKGQRDKQFSLLPRKVLANNRDFYFCFSNLFFPHSVKYHHNNNDLNIILVESKNSGQVRELMKGRFLSHSFAPTSFMIFCWIQDNDIPLQKSSYDTLEWGNSFPLLVSNQNVFSSTIDRREKKIIYCNYHMRMPSISLLKISAVF